MTTTRPITQPTNTAVNRAVSQIFNLYEKWGEHDYIGEDINQLSHMVQAARLAEIDQQPPDVILGALFHDIGQLISLDYQNNPDLYKPSIMHTFTELGVDDHEEIGANFLMHLGFPETTVAGAKLHVQAKRYLVSTHPEYQNKLTEASRGTLQLQGGMMTKTEINEFENHPNFHLAIKYRIWDEASKETTPEPEINLKTLDHYKIMTHNLLTTQYQQEFPSELRTQFEEDGYLHLEHYLTHDQHQQLKTHTKILEESPNTPGKWMKYYEQENPTQLSRIEYYLDFFPHLNQLLNSPRLQYLIELLLGNQSSVLFKEKINFKYPGGGGFAPHQDEPAFAMFPHGFHITVCFPVDQMTPENGCLEIVPKSHQDGILPQNPDQTIADKWTEQHEWQPIPLQTGDILIFGSYLAHRSHPNHSNNERRAHYLTYNSKSKGDHRLEYYQRKRNSIPPEYERDPNKTYTYDPAFNVGNPFNVHK